MASCNFSEVQNSIKPLMSFHVTLNTLAGEYTRDRNMKPKALLLDGEHGEITGLSFKTVNASVILFVSTKFAIFSFDVTNKDREGKV